MIDKVALVTGAASGIGRATALRFAAEGASVACVDVSVAAATQTAQDIVAAGGKATALMADVTEQAACARVVAEAIERYGRLTTLVNSAGVRPDPPGTTPTHAEWQRVIDINLSGSYWMSRAAIPSLVASGSASITNLASIFGLVGGSSGAAYAASKGAIVNLTRQMALEWAPAVRVNCVCPGVIETPMTAGLRRDPEWEKSVLSRYPLRRFGQPEEIASAILFLASDEAAFVTGVALPVDGGYVAA